MPVRGKPSHCAVIWWWCVAVWSVGATPSTTQYVRVTQVLPSGTVTMVMTVRTGVACGGVCEALGCEAFFLEDKASGYLCTVFQSLSSAVRVPANHSQRVYTSASNVNRVKGLIPTTPREQIEDLKMEENPSKRECSSDRGLTALVLRTGDTRRTTVDYFECRKFILDPKMQTEKNDKEEVITEEDKGVQECTGNRVLVAFRAFKSDGSKQDHWDNPPKMVGICHLLEVWNVDRAQCEEVGVTSGPWEGLQEDNWETWDSMIYCPRDTLAVALTRRKVSTYYQFVSLKCCYVAHA